MIVPVNKRNKISDRFFWVLVAIAGSIDSISGGLVHKQQQLAGG